MGRRHPRSGLPGSAGDSSSSSRRRRGAETAPPLSVPPRGARGAMGTVVVQMGSKIVSRALNREVKKRKVGVLELAFELLGCSGSRCQSSFHNHKS